MSKKRPRVPVYDQSQKHRSSFERSETASSDWKLKLQKAKASISPHTTKPPVVPESPLPMEDQSWHYNEAEFHLQQAKLRSQIRIDQDRETQFDLCLQLFRLYTNEIPLVPAAGNALPKEMFEPYTILDGATKGELEAVQSAMEVHSVLEKPESAEYWSALTVICQERIHLFCAQEEAEEKHLKYYTIHGLAQDIYEDLDKILGGKTETELRTLLRQIDSALKDPAAAIDRSYWEGMRTQAHVYIAKAALRRIANSFIAERVTAAVASPEVSLKDLIRSQGRGQVIEHDPTLSPVLIALEEETDLCLGAISLSEATDSAQLQESRARILTQEVQGFISNSERLDVHQNSFIANETSRFSILRAEKLRSDTVEKTVEDLVRLELLKNVPAEEGEEEFAHVVDVKPVLETWMSKYRPRKPKFFNRVKTGYEWNKYNQTHYDHTSPPPKVVQGYKFNIFYPDLIDKTKAPQFYLEPCENSDLCLIRFHAGPPYEDIAFQIVSREWDFSERRGFKNFFDRGVLHLYVNFKRHRYKR